MIRVQDFRPSTFSGSDKVAKNFYPVRFSVSLCLKLRVSYPITNQKYHNSHCSFSFPLHPKVRNNVVFFNHLTESFYRPFVFFIKNFETETQGEPYL